jgi:epoxyqueuosine reductase QueG
MVITTEMALNMPKGLGAALSGIVTKKSLEGAPYTADLDYVLPGARSAILFAVPFDQELIEPFLSKKDFSLSGKKIERTTFSFGISFELSTVFKSLGYEAVPIASNFDFRKDTPNGIYDRIPPISLKLLAAACGIGNIGQSGLLLTKQYGAAFSLGGVVTDLELEATEPLPESENYCDGCLLCKRSCVADFILPEKRTIQMGGRTVRVGNCRLAARCAFPCGGITGLDKSGEWSTWSPGRFPLPEDDEDYRTISKKYIGRYLQRKRLGPVSYNPLLAGTYEMQYTCSNCQFVCHPDKEVRKRRHKMLMESGIVIEGEDGTKHAVSSKEAEEFLERMPEDRRKLFME